MKKLALVAMAVASVSAYAGEDFKVEANGSYIISNAGDGTKTAANFLGLASQKLGNWAHAYRVEAAGTTGTEHYLGSALLASNITDSTQFYAKAQVEKDIGPSVQLDYNAAVTVGLAHQFFKSDVQSLRGEVGIGNRFAKYIDTVNNGDNFNEVIGTFGARYDRKLTDKVTFTQELAGEVGDSVKTYRSRTDLAVAINQNISGLVSHTFKRDDTTGGNADSNTTTFGVKYVY